MAAVQRNGESETEREGEPAKCFQMVNASMWCLLSAAPVSPVDHTGCHRDTVGKRAQTARRFERLLAS